MNENNVLSRVKNHVKENKKYYIVGGVCLVVGAATATIMIGATENAAIQRVIAFKTGDVTQNVIQVALKRRGHPGFIVQCNETGEAFASIRRAAEAMNLDPGSLSKHLNGIKDHVNGYTFTNLGEAK